VSDAERPLSTIGLEADHQIALMSSYAPSSQFSPGIDHARLHGCGRQSENLRSFTDRQSWSRKSEQDDKWSFCLIAGTLCPANQERQ
jgi:hypothetical protein